MKLKQNFKNNVIVKKCFTLIKCTMNVIVLTYEIQRQYVVFYGKHWTDPNLIDVSCYVE